MKNIDQNAGKPALKLVVNNNNYDWLEQYITGEQIRKIARITGNEKLYLQISEPWDDELILNDTRVNLAREGIEHFKTTEKIVLTINRKRFEWDDKHITGEQILNLAGLDSKCSTLYQKFKTDFEKVLIDQIIDLSKKGIEHFITKDADTFTYTVNGEHEMTDKKTLSAKEILKLDAIDADNNYLIQVFEDGSQKSYAYLPDEQIQMSCKGLVFITGKWLDIVDIEEYGKQCKEIPPSRKYRIKIDKDYHIVENRFITASKLIALGGKSDTAYNVYKFMNGNPKPILILPGETVDLTEKCLVRFVLQPKEQKDGRGNRQSFTLPDEDEETLEKMGLQWETLTQPGMWLVIYDYPIPDGYNVSTATLALRITPSYPATEIDMAYFNPPLSKNNGKGISCATPLAIDGKNFQQWSRHRKPGQWIAGVDNLATHLSLVDNWLTNDLKR